MHAGRTGHTVTQHLRHAHALEPEDGMQPHGETACNRMTREARGAGREAVPGLGAKRAIMPAERAIMPAEHAIMPASPGMIHDDTAEEL